MWNILVSGAVLTSFWPSLVNISNKLRKSRQEVICFTAQLQQLSDLKWSIWISFSCLLNGRQLSFCDCCTCCGDTVTRSRKIQWKSFVLTWIKRFIVPDCSTFCCETDLDSGWNSVDALQLHVCGSISFSSKMPWFFLSVTVSTCYTRSRELESTYFFFHSHSAIVA